MRGDELTEDMLSAYADGELDAPTRRAVEARLATSESWRDVLQEVEEARALLRGLPAREAPSGFWDDARRAMEAEDDGDGPSVTPVPIERARSRHRRVWQAAAAVAAAVVVGAVLLVPTRNRTRPPVATMVSTHAARSSLTDEPITQLAPVAGPVRFGR